jgi:hypothetical protein
MRSLAIVGNTLLVLAVGLVVLFLFFLALGAFSPAETIVASIIVAALAVAFAIHMYRVHRALEDGGSDLHRVLNLQRERRGF